MSLIGKRKRHVHLMIPGDLQADAFFVQFNVTETPHAITHTLGISLVDLHMCTNVQNSYLSVQRTWSPYLHGDHTFFLQISYFPQPNHISTHNRLNVQ